ncbi:MAG: OmpA family protein, partial [Deltaproteobacteria bacterium]|nr:OmpA family protein [Deltaproteobacteria bacterium]
PGVRVSIVGHTDNVGDPDTNMELSRKRAAAVKQYLVDGGVADSRIETDGKGDTEPKVPNDSEANRAQNRRIVFKIIANAPTEVRPHEEVLADPDAKVLGDEAKPDAESEAKPQ